MAAADAIVSSRTGPNLCPSKQDKKQQQIDRADKPICTALVLEPIDIARQVNNIDWLALFRGQSERISLSKIQCELAISSFAANNTNLS